MKSRSVKRFLAILGACLMMVSVVPMDVYATESMTNTEAKEGAQSDELDELALEGEELDESSAIANESMNSKEDAEQAEETAGEEETPAEEKSLEDVINSQGTGVISVVKKAATSVTGNTVSGNSVGVTPLADEGDETSEGIVDDEAQVPEDITKSGGTAKVEVDEQSGLNAYIPIESEFTTEDIDGGILVTRFTPTLTQSYDVVRAPGNIGGKDAFYGVDFLNSLAPTSYKGKGVIFENGATLTTSKAGLQISYVRFESGSKAASASGTFKDWDEVTEIVGFGEALAAYGNTSVSFKDTFNNIDNVEGITLNLSGMTAEFAGAFGGSDKLKYITIKNGNVSKVQNLCGTKWRDPTYSSTYFKRRTTFIDITFPENTEEYLNGAFYTMWGSFVFNNCKSGESHLLNFNHAFDGSTYPPYMEDHDTTTTYATFEPGNNSSSYNSFQDSFIVISGASAYSAESMFESASLVSVDLTNFITADTVSVDKMFKGCTLAEIKGVESWRLGALTADEMFNSTRVYLGPKSYLTKTLVPAIKRLDWSKCTSADKLFNFNYKGEYTIDYSGINLSGVDEMTISSLPNYDFVTPGTNPQNFVFEQDTVYELRAGSTLGGKALDPITVVDGKVAGSDIKTNNHVYTDIATISITDVGSDKEVSTHVVPGYKLSEYLDLKIPYYQDRSLTQAVSGDLVVSSGDRISVYCILTVDDVDREIIEGSEVDFGENLDDVEITMADGSTDKLQGGDAEVKIKIEETSASQSGMVVPSAAQRFSKSAFFNIDLIATVGGTDKKITEMSQSATIVLPLPDDYTTGDIKVLNYHDGFSKAPIVLDGVVDKAAGTVTIETDKFSPYVMVYDESVETETVDVTIKWEGDSKDKSGRTDIDLVDTVTYENGSTLDISAKYVKDTTKDETIVTFTYPKTLAGSAFKTHTFTSARDINVDNYNVSFDVSNLTYKFSYSGSSTKEEVNVVVDFSGLSDSDYQSFINWVTTSTTYGKASLTLDWKYDDNSMGSNIVWYKPESGTRIYTVPVEVTKVKNNGVKFDSYTRINAPLYNVYNYEDVVDLDNLKVSFRAAASDSKETTTHNFNVKIVDNNNTGNTRPDSINVSFTANYGDYVRTRSVTLDLSGVTGNVVPGSVVFPTTVGGVAMTKLDATTSTASNKYSSTWNWGSMLLKYTLDGATDTEPDPTTKDLSAKLTILFSGDVATSRPQKVIATVVDSNNQNPVNVEVRTVFEAGRYDYYADFTRLVDDTYHISKVTGFDATKYTASYSGLTATITYNGGGGATTNPPSGTSNNVSVTLNFDDSNDQDGMRPKTVKVTIENSTASNSITHEVTIGSGNQTTVSIPVMSGVQGYTVKNIDGLPKGYSSTISGLTVNIKYTPEKVEKIYKVEWTDDADNADKTRPNSVSLTVKNGSTTVQTVTVSESTNWAANVTLSKYIKGVEASYSVEGADVTNYSKSVNGDTVTYKFTGTLSADAAAIEAGKNGVNGISLDGASEFSYDISNFDWIDYANKYPDLKKAYGYNKEALYAHYIRYGIAEGRVATFTGKYNTVNEDVLAAYFPDDYKFKTDLNAVGEEYLIGKEKPVTTTATSTSNKVTVDENGNIHTTVKNPDGTTTETVTDSEGNIISVSTYKTGDLRVEDMSTLFIILGVLLLITAAFIVSVVIKDDKKKKAVLRMLS